MAKFSREIEVRGHLIDSLILTKIFDGVMDLGTAQISAMEIFAGHSLGIGHWKKEKGRKLRRTSNTRKKPKPS